MDDGYQYIIQNGGIDSEACYPYSAESGTCNYQQSCCAATITGYKDVLPGSETALLAATYVTPSAIGLDASQSSFQFYSSGIYYDAACSNSSLDHSALTVGWGTDAVQDSDYWIVKNSWGVDWGMKGYILMSRNRGNNCGIATLASYPTGCNNCS